jgi:hypothetical protein
MIFLVTNLLENEANVTFRRQEKKSHKFLPHIRLGIGPQLI